MAKGSPKCVIEGCNYKAPGCLMCKRHSDYAIKRGMPEWLKEQLRQEGKLYLFPEYIKER